MDLFDGIMEVLAMVMLFVFAVAGTLFLVWAFLDWWF